MSAVIAKLILVYSVSTLSYLKYNLFLLLHYHFTKYFKLISNISMSNGNSTNGADSMSNGELCTMVILNAVGAISISLMS